MLCNDLWLKLMSIMVGVFPNVVAPNSPCTVVIPPPPPPVAQMIYPSSQTWMTEEEEVEWYKSLGFVTTLTELRASYASFTPKAIDPTTNVMWNTESDELRNFYRLYKRTGHPAFLTQSQYIRDWMVKTYSNWQAGGSNTIETSHIYLMGLIDWYVDKKDAETLAAINRIVDFIIQKLPHDKLIETRKHARAIQSLAYYIEKIGIRTDVRTKLDALVANVQAVKLLNGFAAQYYYVGEGWSIQGLPAGQDLRVLFPGNTAKGIVTGANQFKVKGFYCVSGYQDVIMMHAMLLAGRVTGRPELSQFGVDTAKAWMKVTGCSFYDPNCNNSNPSMPYALVADAPELKMFTHESGSSSPLYNTQFAAYYPDVVLRKQFQIQALLRQYGQSTKVSATELGRKPRYFAWQTWENGYFLTQK